MRIGKQDLLLSFMSSSKTVQLSPELFLVPICLEDQLSLLRLMRRIYLPVYNHLWEDAGDAYLLKTFGGENFTKEMEDANGDYYFVLQGNKPIGILRIRRATPLIDFASEPAMKLHRIYLDPSTQGQGIGKKIIQWCIDQARQAGAKILWLEAMDTQIPALRFYEKLGFQTSGHFELIADKVIPKYCGMIRMYLRINTP